MGLDRLRHAVAAASERRTVVRPLLLVLVALPPLLLAVWGFGRALDAGEISKLDLRVSSAVSSAIADADRRANVRTATATAVARSADAQRAIRIRDLATLRRLFGGLQDVRLELAGGSAPIGALPTKPSLLRRIDVLGPRTKLASLVIATPLAPSLAARDGTTFLILSGGRVVSGPLRGTQLALQPATHDLRLGGTRYRGAVARVGRFQIVGIASRRSADAAAARGERWLAAAAGATLAALALVVALLSRGRRRRSRDGASTDALALVEGVLGAVHDSDAMLHVVLETAVAVSGATGGSLTWRDSTAATGGAGGAMPTLQMPLRDDKGTLVGQLALHAPHGFDRETTALVSAIAARGATALESVRRHHTVHRLAMTDELTELANRRRFREAFEIELSRAERTGAPLSLVLADLDGFKRVNDEYGHQIGDTVLHAVAQVIRTRVRPTDIAARLGGDEFVILLPNTPMPGVAAFVESLRAALEDPKVAPSLYAVTASFGAAEWRAGMSGEAFLGEADRALYAAKRALQAAPPLD